MKDLVRGFAMQPLEVRSEGDGRTVYGIVVPYGQVARVSDGGPHYKEAFQRGAFAKSLADRGSRPVPLLAQHDRQSFAAGASVGFEDRPDGLYGSFRMLNHDKAEAALEAARAGVANFSVGFGAIKHRMDGGVTVRTEAAMREVSLVTFPAYEGAMVHGVRALNTAEAQMAQQLLAALTMTDAQIDALVSTLTATDASVDMAQAALASLLGVSNPDTDDPDEEPEAANLPDDGVDASASAIAAAADAKGDASIFTMSSQLTSLARRLDEAIARRGSTTPTGAGTDEPHMHSGRLIVARNNFRAALIQRGIRA